MAIIFRNSKDYRKPIGAHVSVFVRPPEQWALGAALNGAMWSSPVHVILPATVAENIAYGKPHANMAEIEAAAQYANASAFIEKLPQHYQTVVGDGGAHLSAGETQ